MSKARDLADGTFDTDTLVVDAGNNRVGVGTASPQSPLHLHETTYPEIRLTNSTTGSTGSDGVNIQVAGTTQHLYIWNNENAATILGTNNTERLRIDSSGKVGIGTSSPQTKFSVQGPTTANNIEISGEWIQSFNRGGSPGYQALPIYSSAVTKPVQPAFLTKTQGSSHTGGSWSKFTGFTADVYNTGSNWSLANNRFTAPVSGKYYFFAGGWQNGSSADSRYGICFQINGSGLTYIFGGSEANVDTPIPCGSIIFSLSANDYVELLIYTSGGTRTWGVTSHAFYFGGQLLA